MPQVAMTRLAGLIAQARAGAVTTALIRAFVRRYGVNMQEAAEQDLSRYATFNDFFTRALRPDARPMDPAGAGRIMMPHAAQLRRMIHVPGDLYSVNPQTAAGVPGLFARNERVVCVFEAPHGQPFALVMVGATIVGSMATVWHGVVNPPRAAQVREWHYAPDQHVLTQGQEMGRFLLGSTVVLLWPSNTVQLHPWQSGLAVRLGQAMGQWVD